MNKLFILFFIFISFITASLTVAQSPTILENKIKALKYSLEKDMSQSVDSLISRFIEKNKFHSRVKLEIDENRIKTDTKKQNKPIRAKQKRRKAYKSLPGLTVSEKGKTVAIPNNDSKEKLVVIDKKYNLDKTTLISYIKSVEIEISTPENITVKIKRELRKLIAEQFSSLDTNVNVHFDKRKISNLIKSNIKIKENESLKPKENKIDEFNQIAKSLSENTFNPFFEKISDLIEPQITKIVIVLGIVLLASLGLTFFTISFILSKNTKDFKSLIGKMSETLSQISVQVTNRTDNSSHFTSHSDSDMNSLKTQNASWEEYSYFTSQIKKMILDNDRLESKIIRSLYNTKKYDEIFILSEATNQNVLNYLKPSEKASINKFLRLKDTQNSFEEKVSFAKKLYNFISSVQFDDKSIAINEIKNELNKLSIDQLNSFLEDCDEYELACCLDLLSSLKISHCINKSINIQTFSEVSLLPMTSTSLKSIRKKLELVNSDVNQFQYGNKVMTLRKHLNDEDEKVMFENLDIPLTLSTSELVKNDLETTHDFISQLNIEDIASTLRFLDDECADLILEEMPNTKSQRILNIKYNNEKIDYQLKESLLNSLESAQVNQGLNSKVLTLSHLEDKKKAAIESVRNLEINKQDVPDLPIKKVS